MIEIRVVDEPKQKFSVVLNDRRVTLELWYAVATDRWSMSVSIDGEPVLTGRKIVPGCDLLAAFSLGIGIMFAWSESGADPGRDQLPQGLVRLYHTTQEEVDAAVAS